MNNDLLAFADHDPDFWWTEAQRDMVAGLLIKFGKAQRQFVADLGCGVGGNLPIFERLGFRWQIALDLGMEALVQAKKRHPGATPIRADVTSNLPLADAQFDAVTLLGVTCHRSIADPARAYLNAASLLTPGGILIVTDPAFPILSRAKDRLVMADRRFRIRDLKKLAEQAGLEPLYTGYFTAFAFMPALVLALFDRLFGAPDDRAPALDTDKPWTWLNTLLYRLASWENRAILSGLRFPFGVEVVGVFKKPGTPTT